MCSLQSPLPQIRKAPLHAGLELVREAPSSVDFPGSARPRRPCGTAAPLHTATSQLMHNGRPKRRRTRAPGRVVCSTGCARSFPACPSQRGHVPQCCTTPPKNPKPAKCYFRNGFQLSPRIAGLWHPMPATGVRPLPIWRGVCQHRPSAKGTSIFMSVNIREQNKLAATRAPASYTPLRGT